GIRAGAEVSLVPISGSGWNQSCYADGDPGKVQQSFFNRVSPGYFATMGTAILAGRDFNERDTINSPKMAAVNEAFAQKFFNGANPVGRAFLVQGRAGEPDERYQIVGLVRNTKYYQVREDFEPIVYLSHGQDNDPGPGASFIARTSAGAGETRRAIKAA